MSMMEIIKAMDMFDKQNVKTKSIADFLKENEGLTRKTSVNEYQEFSLTKNNETSQQKP